MEGEYKPTLVHVCVDVESVTHTQTTGLQFYPEYLTTMSLNYDSFHLSICSIIKTM